MYTNKSEKHSKESAPNVYIFNEIAITKLKIATLAGARYARKCGWLSLKLDLGYENL